ncbi:MAG: DUF2147 domain-containing protein [Marinilabiliales bacterium]|nr:MAG: DUF2147 domain-containing protein [Marinilabiliales bacterium]
MKQLTAVFCFMFLASASLKAQADRIIGFWLNDDGKAQIEIYKVDGNKYNGRIVWLSEPFEDDGSVKVDKENPDRSLRNQPIKGLEILKGFTYNTSKQEWEQGRIYDPDNGRTYDCYMSLDGHNTLKIRGFVLGMRWLGRSTEWTRERSLRE